MRTPSFTDLLIKEVYDFLARWEKLVPMLNEQGREVHQMVIRLAKGQLKAVRIWLEARRFTGSGESERVRSAYIPKEAENFQAAYQDKALFQRNFRQKCRKH